MSFLLIALVVRIIFGSIRIAIRDSRENGRNDLAVNNDIVVHPAEYNLRE